MSTHVARPIYLPAWGTEVRRRGRLFRQLSRWFHERVGDRRGKIRPNYHRRSRAEAPRGPLALYDSGPFARRNRVRGRYRASREIEVTLSTATMDGPLGSGSSPSANVHNANGAESLLSIPDRATADRRALLAPGTQNRRRIGDGKGVTRSRYVAPGQGV